VSACADVAFALLSAEPCRRLYFWYTRGDLVVAYDAPPDCAIVTPEPIPGDRTRTGIRAWLWERARCVPCLPPG